MKHKPYLFIFLLVLSHLLVGCSSTTPFGPYVATFDQKERWHLQLNPGPGTLAFTTTLKKHDRIRLLLSRPEWPQLAYLAVLDENCEFGHKGHLVYWTEHNGFQSLYFDQEIPWGEPIHATLTWYPEQGFLEASVNGHRERVDLLQEPTTLWVDGRTDTNTLPELLYQSPVASTSESRSSQ